MSESARTSALEACVVPGRLAAGRRDESRIAEHGDTPAALFLSPGPPAAVALLGGIEDTGRLAEAFAVAAEALLPGRWLLAEPAGKQVILAWAGPGQWLVESARVSYAELIEGISTALGSSAFDALDLSCARTPIHLAGSAAPELLAGLCPIDIETMRPGDGLFTLAGSFDIHLMRMDREVFRLGVPRSFAQAMWETLLRASREFEVEVGLVSPGMTGA